MDRLKDPRMRVRAAAWLLGLSLVGWPLSAFTFAREEPQAVLGLSWLAITFTAVDILATTDVRANEEDGES